MLQGHVDGEEARHVVDVIVWPAERVADDEWACRVVSSVPHEIDCAIIGADPAQARSLATNYACRLLESVMPAWQPTTPRAAGTRRPEAAERRVARPGKEPRSSRGPR